MVENEISNIAKTGIYLNKTRLNWNISYTDLVETRVSRDCLRLL